MALTPSLRGEVLSRRRVSELTRSRCCDNLEVRRVTIAERRARLARRHHLIGDSPPSSVVALADRMVGLHASDPASVFLAAQARLPGITPGAIEAALYDEQVLVKHLGMRRTMFVIPEALLPVMQAACTDEVAATMRRRLVKDLVIGRVGDDAEAWLRAAERDTLAALDRMGPSLGAKLSAAVPALKVKLAYAEGKDWGGDVGIATRVIGLLAAEGHLERGRPSGSWTSSQHRWTRPPARPGSPQTMEAVTARSELIGRWLRAFGPAPLSDIVWWTGLGVGKVRAALARLSVAPVDLGDGVEGLLLADDLEVEAAVAPWVALLPSLDPTTMGWQQRDWYLGPHREAMFDRNGNAGPAIWVDGRIVGGWAQRRDGEVVWKVFEDIGSEATRAIEQKAGTLQQWLGRVVVTPRFPTPVYRLLRA